MDIQEIIEKAGGKHQVANALGLTYMAVHQWKAVPTRHVIKVAKMAKLKPEQVRPEMYQ